MPPDHHQRRRMEVDQCNTNPTRELIRHSDTSRSDSRERVAKRRAPTDGLGYRDRDIPVYARRGIEEEGSGGRLALGEARAGHEEGRLSLDDPSERVHVSGRLLDAS